MLILHFQFQLSYWGHTCSITSRFSSLGCLHVLHNILVKSKSEYALVVQKSVTSTEANTLEHTQQSKTKKKLTSMVSVCEQTISIERPPLVGEVRAKICG
jgi:hypothetical protein